MSADPLNLTPGEWIATAYAEEVSGPGWCNRLVWVVIGSPGGDLRAVAIQPAEQSPALAHLFDVAAVVNRQMVAAVEASRAEGAPRFWRIRKGKR